MFILINFDVYLRQILISGNEFSDFDTCEIPGQVVVPSHVQYKWMIMAN